MFTVDLDANAPAVMVRAMNAIFRSLALTMLGVAMACAGPTTGRIVVLDNENLLEGEVTRVDGAYEIRRPVGGDVTIPANRVLAVVADRKAAFAVVAERANRGDADERLRLARWCASNGLPAEALTEARTAARMRPGFKAAERFAASLEQTAKWQSPKTDPAVIPAKAESSKPEIVAEVPVVEYNSESFPLFASRVNAILLNTCANCHARDDAKAFRLTRASGRATVTKNMMAALPYVNPKDPSASAILAKALMAHGNATEAPFKSRAHPAYEALEAWAKIARAPDGTLAPEASARQQLPELDAPAAGSSAKAPPAPGEPFGADSKSTPPKPLKNEASDPFDPAIFNGEIKKK
jgi:hypothetical protein